MKCTEIKHRLIELLYAESSAEERRSIETHLAGCEACRSEWAALQQSRNLLNRVSVSEKQRDVDVVSLFRAVAVKSEQRRRRWKRTAVAAGSVVAVLLVLVISQLQVQIFPGHAVVGWGVIPPEVQAENPGDLREQFQRHESRLNALDDLANVSARELLESDRRRGVELVRLKRQLDQLGRQTERQLDHMQVQSDLRWRLIQHDLSQRTVQTVSMKHTNPE